jgi:bifunctional non-homologous end joining protein LigD
VIDSEAVVLGSDGVSDFAALNSGKRNEQAHLYAFDMLSGDGEDHRRLALSLRKANLATDPLKNPDRWQSGRLDIAMAAGFISERCKIGIRSAHRGRKVTP